MSYPIKAYQTEKFKNNTVGLYFFWPLSKEKAAEVTVLSRMLSDRCVAFPTKQAMTANSDNFYALNTNFRTFTTGKALCMEVLLSALDDRFCQEGQWQGIFATVKEMIFRPLLNEEVFAEAKRNALQSIARRQEDFSTYCSSQAVKSAGANQPLGIDAEGEQEEVEALSLDDLKRVHQELLEDTFVVLLSTGWLSQDQLEGYAKEYLPFSDHNLLETAYCFEKDDVTSITIDKKTTQAEITVLYNGPVNVKSPDYWALRVAAALLGQFPVSLLFREVREKRSLCYSIFSTTINFDGVLVISTATQKKNIAEVLSLIDQLVKQVANGDFDDSLLAIIKKMMSDIFSASLDRPSGMLNLGLNSVLTKTDVSPEAIVMQISKVDREAITSVFTRLKKIGVAVLCDPAQKEE